MSSQKPMFTLHESNSMDFDDCDASDSSERTVKFEEFEKKLNAAVARSEFHAIGDNEDPYCPGETIPDGMRKVCLMIRASEKNKEKIDELKGTDKIFATFGKDLVLAIDKLVQELYGARPLADVYLHSELVLHNLTRLRLAYDKRTPNGTLVQFIKLDKKGLPMAKQYRTSGFYEPVAHYNEFFLFLVPAEKHAELERWATKLYERQDSYDLRTTTTNAILRYMDLALFEKWLLRRGRTAEDDEDDGENDETIEPIKQRNPVRLLQSLFGGKVKYNCCTLTIKALKILGILTEEDVSKSDADFFTNMDLVRLMLSKTRGVGDSLLKKWDEANHFVISQELHVTWRKFKTQEDREKAMEEYKEALVKQHKVGLAAADEAMTAFLQRRAMRQNTKNTGGSARQASLVERDDEDGDEDDDYSEKQTRAPLISKPGRKKK